MPITTDIPEGNLIVVYTLGTNTNRRHWKHFRIVLQSDNENRTIYASWLQGRQFKTAVEDVPHSGSGKSFVQIIWLADDLLHQDMELLLPKYDNNVSTDETICCPLYLWTAVLQVNASLLLMKIVANMLLQYLSKAFMHSLMHVLYSQKHPLLNRPVILLICMRLNYLTRPSHAVLPRNLLHHRVGLSETWWGCSGQSTMNTTSESSQNTKTPTI